MTFRIDLDAVPGNNVEASPLTATAVPGAPTDLVPVTAGQTRTLRRTEFPAVLVTSSSGGAGSTTVTLGLAAALASYEGPETDLDPVCVDATPSGTDLAERGCDALTPPSTLQSWLGGTQPGLYSAVAACTGQTGLGVRVMARTPDALPRRETIVSAHRHLRSAGMLPIFDGGPATNRETLPLLADSRIGLIITVAARPDHLNRLRRVLTWLDSTCGEFLIGEALIVVTEQAHVVGLGEATAKHLRDWLGTWVRGVVPLPFDSHLAAGGLVSWQNLAPATRRAFRQIAGDLQ